MNAVTFCQRNAEALYGIARAAYDNHLACVALLPQVQGGLLDTATRLQQTAADISGHARWIQGICDVCPGCGKVRASAHDEAQSKGSP
jgi:hypothetical protein